MVNIYLKWSFIKRQTCDTSIDNECKRVVQRVTTNGNEWQQISTRYCKWKWLAVNDSEWSKNENKWGQVKLQNETKSQSTYNYYIFSNIDNLVKGKLMTYFQYIFFCLYTGIISSFFSLSILLKLLKHVKLIVKCELLF